MAVYDASESFDVKLQQMAGWLRATAAGEFGQVEGWIRFDENAARPAGLANENIDRQINLWGRSRDGEKFHI